MRVYIPNINFTNPVGKTALCLLQTPEPKRIYKRNRVTVCISKAVKSNRVGKLSGNDIRIDESACFGIVITTVKVIKTCLCVVVIAAVTYRVEITDVICSIIIDRKYLTPCVVCISLLIILSPFCVPASQQGKKALYGIFCAIMDCGIRT